MTTITIDRAVVEQALEALEADCGGRCNAEYNPCWQREVAETLHAALAQQAEPVAVDVDALAQHIRFVDGNHNLGAGILAEKIVEFLIKLGIGKEQAEPVEPVEPAAVPLIDYEALIAAAYAANKKWAQGTSGCVAFKHGAEWFRSQTLAALAQQAEPTPDTCTWWQDGDSDSGVYGTSCGRYFNLEDGTPEDNKMHWCCYCGKTLAQELITENSDVMAYNAARPGGSDSSDGLGPL